MQVYLMNGSEATQVDHKIKNGVNVVNFKNSSGTYTGVRLDYVTEPGISLVVVENSIVFNDSLPILCEFYN